MPAADRGTTFGGLPFDGPWTECPSPLSLNIAAASEVVWTSAGRRMALALSSRAGLVHAASDGHQLLGAVTLTINGVRAGAGALNVTPVEVRRRVSGAAVVEERWLTALELPLAFWELDVAPAAMLVLEARLTPGVAGGGCHVAPGRTNRSATLVHASGQQLMIAADGGTLELRPAGDPAAMRMTLSATGRVRLALISAHDEPDLQRTLHLAGRKGFAGLRSQRMQHERLVREYGTSIATPVPAFDAAFEWAKLRADEALRAAGQADGAIDLLAEGRRERGGSPGLDALLAAPERFVTANPVDLIRCVVGELWGIEADAAHGAVSLAPQLPAGWPRMTLSRLRVGRSVLDCEVQRRSGRVVLRVRRRSGPPLVLSAVLPGADITALSVDGVALGGARARFEVAGEHEVLFDVG